ncbi:MAG: hypothetical protein GF355_03565 [Candidatus Eisenbacteria bacterium]|nr:hypothetical protein [Candidatus Eisenbacteria bacterium]
MPCFDLLRRQLLRTAAGHSEPIPLSRRMAALYECMPSCDLSRDILARARRHTLVMPMIGIDWCDWGRAERIEATLRELGKRPYFATSSAASPQAHPVTGVPAQS